MAVIQYEDSRSSSLPTRVDTSNLTGASFYIAILANFLGAAAQTLKPFK